MEEIGCHFKIKKIIGNIYHDTNKERLAFYQQAYNNALESSIKKINLPTNDICFKCNEVMRTSIILP